MIGVILWRDVADSKSVIWCEDQGDLVFFDGLNDSVQPEVLLDVGDVVRFEVAVARNARLAKNVTRLKDNWGSTLVDALTNLPPELSPASRQKSAKVVPFNYVYATHSQAEIEELKRRHG